MDFDLSTDQQSLLDQIDKVVSASDPARAAEISGRGGYDRSLDEALHEALDPAQSLDELSVLDRLLVTERLAELGTATTFGLALMVGHLTAGVELRPGGLAVASVGRRGPVRYAGHADTVIFVSATGVTVADARVCASTPVRSGFGFPYARVEPPAADDVAVLPGAPDRWRDALTLAACAEVAGNAASSVARTAEHLRERVQFGRPLATFQALRHRLADAAVSAEATRWLAREAAYGGAARDIAIAASYAQQTAAALVPELVQLGGARSFAREFGMHVFTMRLTALRLELGGPDRLAAAVNAEPAGDWRVASGAG